MKGFEFYRGRCKQTTYFYCQIVLKDYSLLLLENDLPKLLSINEDDILYFVAVWQPYEIKKNGKAKSSDGGFRRISSNSVDTGKSALNDDYTFAPYVCYAMKKFFGCYFGLDIIYNLHDKVDAEILEAYIPRLFENYTAQNKPERFLNEWETEIAYWKGWKHERDIFLRLSKEDKVIYEQAQIIINNFDNTMKENTMPSGEYSWFSIVWNSVQVIRNGGGIDEVVEHLSKSGRRYGDEYKEQRNIYENNRKETAKKLIKLVREN